VVSVSEPQATRTGRLHAFLKDAGHILTLLLILPVGLASEWADNHVGVGAGFAVCITGAGLVWLVAYRVISWQVER
jgi:hypothetical protein